MDDIYKLINHVVPVTSSRAEHFVEIDQVASKVLANYTGTKSIRAQQYGNRRGLWRLMATCKQCEGGLYSCETLWVSIVLLTGRME